jgi:hypothetical protein
MAKHKELVKRLGIELPEEIYDDETGVTLQYDEEKINRAISIVSRVQNNIVTMAELISEFYGDKLYLYLGLSKAESGSVCFGMSPSSILQFERIARTFGDRLVEFSSLGLTRLDAISSLPEEQRLELLNSKKITLNDGTELTYEELGAMKVKELEKNIRAERLKYSKLKTQFEEIKEEYSSEVIQFKGKIVDLERLVNMPPEEVRFHKQITKKSEVQNKIKEATAGMYDAFMKLYQIEIDETNASVALAGIEGFVTETAKRLLSLEADHGALLDTYKDGIQKLARVK